MFLLKISLGQDLRQIAFTSLPTYSVLRTVVSCLFFDLGAKVSILYVDDEEDVVSIHSDLELQEAVRLAQKETLEPTILRLYVNVVETVAEETEEQSILTELGTSLASVTDAVTKFFATIDSNIMQFFEEVSTACQEKLASLAALVATTSEEKPNNATEQDEIPPREYDENRLAEDCLILERMGFTDRSKNLALLHHYGEIDRVVELLLVEESATM